MDDDPVEPPRTRATGYQRVGSADIDESLLRSYSALPLAMQMHCVIAGMLRGLVKAASWRRGFGAIGFVIGGTLTAILAPWYRVIGAIAGLWVCSMLGGYVDERWRARARLRVVRDEAARQQLAATLSTHSERDGPRLRG